MDRGRGSGSTSLDCIEKINIRRTMMKEREWNLCGRRTARVAYARFPSKKGEKASA